MAVTRRLFSFVAFAGLVLASVAHGQDGPAGMESGRIISFGIGGGVSVPVRDAADAFKTGFNGRGFVRFNLSQLPIAPRVDFTFNRFDLDQAAVGASGNGQILAGVANVQWFVLNRGPVRPYLVAGLGAYHLKTTATGTGTSSTSDTRFGVNGGAGLLIKLGGLLSAYAEGRVDNLFTEAGLIASDKVQVVPVTFGIVF